MSLRMTKAQREVLQAMRAGEPFCEYLTPDTNRLFFRTLGPLVHAKLNYSLGGKRVSYRTFWKLFKFNLIQPARHKASPPQSGIKQFYLNTRAYTVLDEIEAKR